LPKKDHKDKIHWRCFHCGAVFTKAQKRWAANHFGNALDETPVCLIRSAGEDAVLMALRNAQEELFRYRNEDQDLMRAMMAQSADHAVALRRVEELGYSRGLADARIPEEEPELETESSR
jgi:hypothetical protein